MPYQAETQLPPLAAMTFFQWETLTAPNPALAASISSTATTIQVTAAPKDETGAVIQKAFLMGIKNDDSYVETVLVPTGALAYDAQTVGFTVGAILTGGTSGAKAKILRDTDAGTTGTLTLLVYSGTFQDNETITDGSGGSATANGTLTPAVSADGLTLTGCVRGIRLTGLDFTSTGTGLATSFDASSAVTCNITGVMQQLMLAALQGTIATGGANLIMGTDADGTVTIKRSTGTGTSVGWVRWNTSTDMAQFSNDGAAWVNFSDSNSSTTFKVSANDTTPGYLNGKLVAGTNTTLTENNDGGNETLQVNAAGALASIVTDVTATAAEINTPLDGVSANVTATNLNTLTAGPASNADALHSHSTPALSGMAYEAITALDAVASLPIEVQWYSPLVETDRAIGSSNTLRKYAMKVVSARNITDLSAVLFRAKEAVNGATVGNMAFSIETDNAGAPSGTPVANGTASFTQATLRTWGTTYATRTANLAGNVSLTKGTTYWFVWAMDATDAANYIKLGDATTYAANQFLTFTRLTYNLDTTSWGSSTDTAPLFFWTTPSNSLGAGLCKTDDDSAQKKFNFVGFATANASAYASCSYYYDTVPGLTVTVGSEYYLSGTAGAITTTGTSGGYKIGYAFMDYTGAKLFKIKCGAKVVISSASVSSSTTQNVDTFIETGFKISHAEITYTIKGETSATEKTTCGILYMLPDGSISGCSFLNNASGGTAFTEATFTPTSGYTVAGSAAGVYLIATMTIQSITQNGFFVRMAYTASGGPSARTTNFRVKAYG